MKVDYYKLINAGWEEYDIEMDYCSICGEYKLCKKFKRVFPSGGMLLLSVCEDCFTKSSYERRKVK